MDKFEFRLAKARGGQEDDGLLHSLQFLLLPVYVHLPCCTSFVDVKVISCDINIWIEYQCSNERVTFQNIHGSIRLYTGQVQPQYVACVLLFSTDARVPKGASPTHVLLQGALQTFLCVAATTSSAPHQLL